MFFTVSGLVAGLKTYTAGLRVLGRPESLYVWELGMAAEALTTLV